MESSPRRALRSAPSGRGLVRTADAETRLTGTSADDATALAEAADMAACGVRRRRGLQRFAGLQDATRPRPRFPLFPRRRLPRRGLTDRPTGIVQPGVVVVTKVRTGFRTRRAGCRLRGHRRRVARPVLEARLDKPRQEGLVPRVDEVGMAGEDTTGREPDVLPAADRIAHVSRIAALFTGCEAGQT